MKQIQTKIAVAISLTVFTIMTQTSISSAQTTLSNGALCPAGYSCIPTTRISCPTGYVCIPLNSTSTQNTTSAYTPRTWSNMYLNIGNTTNTYSPSRNSATSTATSTYTSQSTTNTRAVTGGSLGFTIDDIKKDVSRGPSKSYPANPLITFISAGQYTVPSIGATVESKCKPGEFFLAAKKEGTVYTQNILDSYAVGGGCVKNYLQAATSSSITFSTPVPRIIKDPYCPNYKDGINTQENIDCVIGEANRIPNYKNPWITADNLAGVKVVTPNASARTPTGYKSTNYCKNIVGFDDARRLDAESRKKNITTNYLSLERIVNFNSSISVGSIINYYPTNIGYGGEHIFYFWNGKIKAEPYKSADGQTDTRFYERPLSDWSDPKFQELYQFYQIGAGGRLNGDLGGLAICLDDNYKSNVFGTEWAGHFQSAIYQIIMLGYLDKTI